MSIIDGTDAQPTTNRENNRAPPAQYYLRLADPKLAVFADPALVRPLGP